MSTNPFNRALPVIVMLRNKQLATVESLVDDCPPFHLLGALGTRQELGPKDERAGDMQLWRVDGRWLDNGRPHTLDIIGVAIPVQTSTGTALGIEPFAPAAGQKGPL